MPGEPAVCPAELLENHALLIGRDAGPAVADLDPDAGILPKGADRDVLPGRRVLDGVVEQVGQHLLQPVAVAAHGREHTVHVRDHVDLVLPERDARNRVTNERTEIHVRETVGEGAGVDPRRVKDVSDQSS